MNTGAHDDLGKTEQERAVEALDLARAVGEQEPLYGDGWTA